MTKKSFEGERTRAVMAMAVVMPFALGCSSGAAEDAPQSDGGSAGMTFDAGGVGASGAPGGPGGVGTGGVGAAAGAGGSSGSGGTGSSSGGGGAGASGVSGTSGASGAAGGSAEGGGGSGASGAGGAAGVSGAETGGAAGSAATGGLSGGGGDSGSGGGAGDGAGCATGSVVTECTGEGTSEIACHLGGQPGNYAVTLTLGGDSAGSAYVEAEMYRRMFAETTTEARQTTSARFVVNVREPEGQPIQNGANEGRPGLDVYVRGEAPQLAAICFEPVQAPVMIWVGGDSTVCDQSGTDYSGWAQHLPQFFDAPVTIANYADSGESSGSFLSSGSLFGAIKSRWQAGDWFFLQLGHNDKNTTASTFEANMTSFVMQSKAAGVNLVLVTPIARVGGALADQHVNSTGANLPEIIRDLGDRENVPVIDLTVATWNWLQTITWQDHFALGTDRTHPNPKGAAAIADLVRDAIVSQDLAIASHLR